jgi:hypothetical protein
MRRTLPWFFATLLAVAACSNGGSAPLDIAGTEVPLDAGPGDLSDLPLADLPVDGSGSDADLLDLSDGGDGGTTDLPDIPGDGGGSDGDGGTTDLPDIPGDGGGDDGDGGDAVDAVDSCIPDCPPPLPEWGRSLGGASWDKALGVAMAPNGDALVGGHTGSSLFYLDDKLQAVLEPDDPGEIFVTRIGPDGGPLWTRTFGNTGDDRVRAIAADGTGAVIVGGLTMSGSLDFDGHVSSGGGSIDGYVARLTPAGDAVWGKVFGGPADEVVLSVAADGSDNVLVGGYFGSLTVDLGSGPVANTQPWQQFDLLMARLSPEDGTPHWVRAFGSDSFDYVHSLAAAADGRVCGAGGISGSGMVFGEQTLSSKGLTDIWIGCLSAEGEPLWARSYGGPAHDAAHALAVSPAGEVYVTGSFQSGVIDFGGGPIPHVGPESFHDIFLLKLSPAGEHIWSRGFGGLDWDLAKSIALSPQAELLVAGSFNSPGLSLGGSTFTGPGPGGKMSEVFVAAYSTDGDHRWSQAFGGVDDDVAYGIAAGSGGFVVAGTFNGKTDGQPAGTMDPGCGPLPPLGNRDSFLLRYP